MNRLYLALPLVFVFAVLHSPAYAEKICVKQQITNNTVDDRNPVLTDRHVAWLSRLNADNDEVYVFDGNTTTRLTNNVLNDENLFASADTLAWEKKGSDLLTQRWVIH